MKQPRHAINGWINLNKPLHLTSADAVNKVKWLLKPQKIGHAGTLDPLATGVLPLALGEGTKCVNLLMDAKKIYEFSVTFGERRSTDDAEGEVVATSETIPTEAQIRAVLPEFTGEIMQLPPIYSALKVAGKRAYDMARAGEEVVLAPRAVTIYALEFLGFGGAQENPGDRKLGNNGEGREALSPCGRGLGEGAVKPRAYMPPPYQEQIQSHAQDLRTHSTEAETKLWNILRSRRLDGYKFRRQHPIDHYIADFVCLEQGLVIELDGGQHTVNVVKDALRTAYLESQGFKVLRFWNHDVFENVEGVVERVRAALLQPLTQPSPARGEGSPVAPLVNKNQSSIMMQVPVTAHFRAQVSKGTYIRSLGRDIAQKCGSEGYISRLHRAAVGPFTDADAISLDFLAESVHKAPPIGELSAIVTPLHAALDDIPALALDGGQVATLRHGQRVTLAHHHPDTPLLAALHQGELVGLVKVEGNQVISVRLLNIHPMSKEEEP